MTFPAASGHGNFVNGNAFPTIFAKEVIEQFRQNLVSSAITNTKFEGEIADSGDTVNIINEPSITITNYSRGAIIPDQDILDDQVQLLIDQGKSFSFKLDDIEERLSHINWMTMLANRAAFDLKKAVDTDILEVIRDNGSTNSALGTDGSAKNIGYATADDYTPINYLSKLDQILNENDVPEEDRFCAFTPAFLNELRQEEGSLVDASVSGRESAMFANQNQVGSLFGMDLYVTTNMPVGSSSDPLVMAGHRSATATATALIKTKIQDVDKSFGQRLMGVVAYGRKVIRPEGLFVGRVGF
jgi:hypothetical protein